MYSLRTTPGFVIDSRVYGEADRVVSIFTREFGLIATIAKGVRLERSKLRYGLAEYSLGNFALIRGREFWRLTSSVTVFPSPRSVIVARVAMLLRRFLHGEEPNQALFDVVESLFDFLDKNPDLDEVMSRSLESLVVIRILSLLGYVGLNKQIPSEIMSGAISLESLTSVGRDIGAINRDINKAMKESHL